MPSTPAQLMRLLQETKGDSGAPFGVPLTEKRLGDVPSNFIRMLICLELDKVRYCQLPTTDMSMEQLINKVVQHRQEYRESSDAHPALLYSHIQQVLQDFFDDDYSVGANRRWLVHVLRVPSQSKDDPEYISALFEKIVTDFFTDQRASEVGPLNLSKHSLAMLALYRHILVITQTKRQGPMLLGPIFRLMSNSLGHRGKQYLPEDQCGEDVELTANRMPAYWREMQDSVEQPDENLQLAVASPPVMCWICGEGFLHNGALFKHCGEKHGDYAEYRKRLFWRVQKDGFKQCCFRTLFRSFRT